MFLRVPKTHGSEMIELNLYYSHLYRGMYCNNLIQKAQEQTLSYKSMILQKKFENQPFMYD